jgi:transcriptional regulator with XRE-family HTH domain
MASLLLRNIGENLRAKRVQLGLSQEQLALLCGLHRTYIGSVERFERNLTINTLERIARAIGVDPLALLEGKKKNDKTKAF